MSPTAIKPRQKLLYAADAVDVLLMYLRMDMSDLEILRYVSTMPNKYLFPGIIGCIFAPKPDFVRSSKLGPAAEFLLRQRFELSHYLLSSEPLMIHNRLVYSLLKTIAKGNNRIATALNTQLSILKGTPTMVRVYQCISPTITRNFKCWGVVLIYIYRWKRQRG